MLFDCISSHTNYNLLNLTSGDGHLIYFQWLAISSYAATAILNTGVSVQVDLRHNVLEAEYLGPSVWALYILVEITKLLSGEMSIIYICTNPVFPYTSLPILWFSLC